LHRAVFVKSHTQAIRIVATLVALLLPAAGRHLEARGLGRASAPGGQKAGSAAKAKKPARPRFEEHQIPAGTTLPIELRTRLSSNGNRPADAIEGRLLRPLTTRDGFELIPAGASVLGTVSEAEPAGIKHPGRLAFTFQVVEHPETGSRAMIKASLLTFESEPPVKGKLFADVHLEKGTNASVLLLAPLLVRLPIGN
jgi:hypothetical protein